MKKNSIVLMLIALCFAVQASALDLRTTETKAAAPAMDEALFAVPNLTADLSKTIAKGLAELKGIVSSKPDLEKATMTVVFEPDQCKLDQVKDAMTKAAPDSKFEKSGPASEQTKKDCSKCPSRDTCTREKTKQ
jgi:hypothetical protein